MFTKAEFFTAVVISLIGGTVIGYNEARGIFMEAMAKAALENNVKKDNDKAEEES